MLPANRPDHEVGWPRAVQTGVAILGACAFGAVALSYGYGFGGGGRAETYPQAAVGGLASPSCANAPSWATTDVYTEDWDSTTQPTYGGWSHTKQADPPDSITSFLGDNALTYVLPDTYSVSGSHTGYTHQWLGNGLDKDSIYICDSLSWSANWVSHPSGINKVMYLFNRGYDNGMMWLIANMPTTDSMTLRVAYVGAQSMGDAYLKWDSQFSGNTGPATGTYLNAAAPTYNEAHWARGEKVQIEVATSFGAINDSTGFVKVWTNGVLTHDYSGIAVVDTVSADTNWEQFNQTQYAPVFGGTGSNGSLPSPDQRFYVHRSVLKASAN